MGRHLSNKVPDVQPEDEGTRDRRERAERVIASMSERPRGVDSVDFRSASEHVKVFGAQLGKKVRGRAAGKNGRPAA